MQFKTPAPAVADHPQILGPGVTGKIQFAGVLNNQILPRLPTSQTRPFQVGLQNSLKIHCRIIEEWIGGFELSPVREDLRQCPAWMGGKLGGDVHQAFTTTWVAQLGKRKFVLGPLTSWLQSGYTHKPTGEEPTGRAAATPTPTKTKSEKLKQAPKDVGNDKPRRPGDQAIVRRRRAPVIIQHPWVQVGGDRLRRPADWKPAARGVPPVLFHVMLHVLHVVAVAQGNRDRSE